MDIEPDGTPADGVTARTGDMVFDACRFVNNKGSQFVGGDNGRNTENVTIRNSEFVGRAGNKHPYVIILSRREPSLKTIRSIPSTAVFIPLSRKALAT